MQLKESLLKNPYISLLQTAWVYAREKKRSYLITYGMFVISNLIHALEPILWGVFINQVQTEGMNVLRHTWWYVGAYFLIWLGDWIFHGFARIQERKLAFHLSRNFLEELYHKAIHLPVKWHQDNHSGVTINRIRKAYEALKSFFDTGMRYIHAIMKFAISFIAMIYFSPLFGSIALLIGVGVVFIIFTFDKPFIAATKEVNEREHIVSSTLFDSLSNIITVITLRLEKRLEKGLSGKVGLVYPPFLRKVIINEWKWFTVDFCIVVIYATILLGYVYQNYVPGEVFLIGGLVTLVGYVQRFTSVFHDIAWQYTEIVKHHTDVTTAQNIVDAYDEQHIADEERLLPKDWKTIDIKNLNFLHAEPMGPQKIIHGLWQLNLQIKRGKKIALIGESGSGKSTLLALLRGLYPPKSGLEINADNKQFDDLEVLSNYVTLFPQEPEIFENTIEYNITLGIPCEREELDAICTATHFKEVVAHLPKGYESNIQEKGVNLSGGQKQRLALARGVFAAKDSDIILLDEPTSSVDPKTEVLIYDQLFETFADKAVVSTLHRLHLLPKFDHVYIMENGKIVDEGSFEHLKANSTIFQELWKHQEESMRVH
jgi:ABC-type multidrug transport system fused ATPase/permease subunit